MHKFINKFAFSGFALAISLVVIIYNDRLFYVINSGGQSQYWSIFWGTMTQFGDGFFVVLLSIIVLRKYSGLTANAVLALIISLILTQTIKEFIGGPRPVTYYGDQLVNVIGPRLGDRSFPSGHSATIFLFCTLLWKNQVLPKLKSAWFIFASIVSISRVAVGAHFPVDIVAGAWIGVFSGYMGWYLSGKMERYTLFWRRPSIQLTFTLAAILSIPFMFINFKPSQYFPGFYIAWSMVVLVFCGFNIYMIWSDNKRTNNSLRE